MLVGSGGVGKSEMARQYWRLNVDDFDGNIIWINANTINSIEDAYKNVGQLLKLKINDPCANKLKAIETIVKMVHDYFNNEKMLFVYDNCSDQTKQKIIKFISKDHFTIVTSQLTDWPPSLHKIEVDKLTLEDGKLFCEKRLVHEETVL